MQIVIHVPQNIIFKAFADDYMWLQLNMHIQKTSTAEYWSDKSRFPQYHTAPLLFTYNFPYLSHNHQQDSDKELFFPPQQETVQVE